MRKDKDIKRRLQLSKHTGKTYEARQADETRRSGRVMFPKASGNTNYVYSNSNSVAEKVVDFNKRTTAFILVLVFLISVIPVGVFMHLRSQAEEANKAMEPVVMAVRVNGQDTGKTAIVQAGEITPSNINLGDYELPDGVAYVKSVVYDTSTETETQIYAVGQKDSTDYYSIKQGSYTGVEKANNDRLILDYANKYTLHFNGTEDNGRFVVGSEGSYTTNAIKDTSDGSWFIYGGEDLVIKEITPEQDHTNSRVTYSSAKTSGTERISNSEATISAASLKADTTVSVVFNEIASYTVQDARYMSGSKYYSQYYGVDNHGGTSQSLSSRSKTNSLKSVDPGDDAVFYVYSQKNTTNKEQWKLSMLSINGVDLKFPADGAAEGTSVTTKFDDTRDITVTYISDTAKFGESGNRTAYKITVPNVHENLEVNYYFTNIKERKLIVKGLTGINKTAASVENYALTGDWFGKWYTYTSSKINVYDAFYDSRSNYPADNLVLYTVKPGYNPYAISVSMFDGQTGKPIDIRASSTTGAPVDVIASAGYGSTGNFNTDWRHWGRNGGKLLKNEDSYGVPKKVELLLTTIAKDVNNTWYAVALAQSTAMNQQLYLNAPMYPYAFAYDLNGGDESSMSGTYAKDGNYLVDENNLHYIDGDDTYGFLPMKAPIRSGYEFVGWVMLDADGKMLDELKYTYKASDRIDINTETIGYAYGEKSSADNSVIQQIRFKAVWNEVKVANTAVTVSAKVQNGVDGDGNKTYDTVLNYEEEQQQEGKTALLNDTTGLSGDKHYVVNSESELVKATNASGTNNDFSVIYDYNLLDFTVKNTVLGYPKTQRFEIKVTLKKSDDSPVDLEKASIKPILNTDESVQFDQTQGPGDQVTYTLILSKDQYVTFKNVPYGWTYTVAEEEKENDYTREISSENGTIEKDMEVEVTNMSDSSELHTTKKISFNEETGLYDLKLEAWATGDKISKYDKDPIPTDIALVIDQSGSMATTDMNPTYTPAKISSTSSTNKTSWTVSEATSGKQYYVKVNGKYYPVLAGEGTLYEKLEAGKTVKVYSLVGPGHNVFSVGLNGVPTYYNIKTKYFYPDSSGVMRTVYTTSSACLGNFRCFQYIFNSDANEKTYGSLGEQTGSAIYLWPTYPWKAERLTWISQWNSWYKAGVYEWIGGSHSNTHSEADKIQACWNWLGENDYVKSDLYQIKDGTNYNHLYYVNEQGNPVQFSTSANLESDVVYKDVLYETTGESRVYALQDAVKEFVEMVADSAATNKVDHRISMIGFAGNKTPALSTTNGIWHATPNGYNNYYDYVNTGLFLKGNFQNYQTITSFSQASTAYLNWHYYVNKSSYTYNTISYGSNKLAPVLYDGSAWKYLGTTTTATDTKYTPNYTALSDQNYLDSLVSVSPETNPDVIDSASLVKDTTSKSFVINSGEDTDNGVNDYLDTAITQFGSYGGTYTSYGMSMANRVLTLAKAQDTNNERQRVIVVFTDGEPGANGYDSSIANEAIFDSNDSKDSEKLDAKVYTVGLYTGNVSKTVESFMKQLSSEYSSTATTKVYSGNLDGENSSLDNTKTYYFKDPSDNKTYSLSAVKNGAQTIGWWSKTGNDSNGYVYSSYEPMSASDEYDGRGYNSDNDTYAFFKNTTDTRNKNNAVYFANLDKSKTYYLYDGTPVNYENRWYDSNNRIRDPLRYDGDTEGSGNRYQFYEMGEANAVEDSEQYYYSASTAENLKKAFQQINDSMVKSMVKLDAKNSILRDVVTGNFKEVKSDQVTVSTIDGEYDTDAKKILWNEETKTSLSGATVTPSYNSSDKTTQIDVKGFDYSKQYITEEHKGQKVVVEITGLTAEELGYNLESNTNASGVIETGTKSGKTYEDMLAPFEIPSINRYQHNLKVEGLDKATNYGMKLVLTPKEEGPTIPDSLTVYYRTTDDENVAAEMKHNYDASAHALTFTNGVANWPAGTTAESFSSLILEDLDDKYEINMMVDEPATSNVYDYSLAVDNKSKQFSANYLLDREKTQTTLINSTQKLVPVTLREITQMKENASGDYTDDNKEFTIQLTLTKDSNGTKLGEETTYDGITFDEDGKATITMKHLQTRTIDLPSGYYLAIDVDPDTQDGVYTDTYTRGTTADNGTDATTNNAYAPYVIESGQYITIYNSRDDIPVEGIFDSNHHVIIYILSAAGVLALAAGGYYVWRRKDELTAIN